MIVVDNALSVRAVASSLVKVDIKVPSPHSRFMLSSECDLTHTIRHSQQLINEERAQIQLGLVEANS